jgi:hypothetical protein
MLIVSNLTAIKLNKLLAGKSMKTATRNGLICEVNHVLDRTHNGVWVSTSTRLWAVRSRNWGSIPGKGNAFSFLQRQDRSEVRPASYLMGSLRTNKVAAA